MSIERQIQTLLREHGSLSTVPNRSTIKDRIASGEYLYVTADNPRGAVTLKDQAGNPVILHDESVSDGEAKVVGVIGFRKLNWYLGEVRHFVVAPEYSDSGLREALMEMAEAKAQTAKVQALVHTSTDVDMSDPESSGFDESVFDFANPRTGHSVTVLLKHLT